MISSLNFILSWVKNENSFITSGPGQDYQYLGHIEAILMSNDSNDFIKQ